MECAKDGNHRALGTFAEGVAAAHVARLGYTILGRNVRQGRGEIDILALEDGMTVFVEVRARRAGGLGGPQWSLSPAKMARMRRDALALLAARPDLPQEARIDLVAITIGRDGRVAEIDVMKSAVEG